jgi:hypothetical protein
MGMSEARMIVYCTMERDNLYKLKPIIGEQTGDESKNKETAVAGSSEGSTKEEDRHAHEPVRGWDRHMSGST